MIQLPFNIEKLLTSRPEDFKYYYTLWKNIIQKSVGSLVLYPHCVVIPTSSYRSCYTRRGIEILPPDVHKIYKRRSYIDRYIVGREKFNLNVTYSSVFRMSSVEFIRFVLGELGARIDSLWLHRNKKIHNPEYKIPWTFTYEYPIIEHSGVRPSSTGNFITFPMIPTDGKFIEVLL